MGSKQTAFKQLKCMEALLVNEKKLAFKHVPIVAIGFDSKYVINRLIQYYQSIQHDEYQYDDNDLVIDDFKLINGFFRKMSNVQYLNHNVFVLIHQYYMGWFMTSYHLKIDSIVYHISNIASINDKLYESHCKQAIGTIVCHSSINQCQLLMDSTNKTIKSILTIKDPYTKNTISIASDQNGHELIEPYYQHWFNSQ